MSKNDIEFFGYSVTNEASEAGPVEFAATRDVLAIFNGLMAENPVQGRPAAGQLIRGPGSSVAARGLGLICCENELSHLISPFGSFLLPEARLRLPDQDGSSQVVALTFGDHSMTTELVSPRRSVYEEVMGGGWRTLREGPYRQVRQVNGVELPSFAELRAISQEDLRVHEALVEERKQAWIKFGGAVVPLYG